MASPFWQCPQCHSVTRKNDNAFEMVEISAPNTVFAVAGAAPCPDCGARNNFDDVYLHPKYDVSIEDVYGGKCGVNLQLVRRASEAGQIRLSEEEQRLLRQVTGTGSSSGSFSALSSSRCPRGSSPCLGLSVTAVTVTTKSERQVEATSSAATVVTSPGSMPLSPVSRPGATA